MLFLCLNGGPRIACDYIRDSHSHMVDYGSSVAFDQLGCGASDRPDDVRLWTLPPMSRRSRSYGPRSVLANHLLGQSWGTWLGIEYALTYPNGFKTLTLANGAANIPHLVSELERLRGALGSETVAMMRHHEADGTLNHPEYKGAIDILKLSPCLPVAGMACAPWSVVRKLEHGVRTWRSRDPTNSVTPVA